MLLYSKHAREQMTARGISESEVESAIAAGAKEFQEPNKLLFHYRFYCVVTKKIVDDYYIITVKPR